MQKLLFLFVFTFFVQENVSLAQVSSISFQQLDSLQQIEKRNVVVFISTNWCLFCAAMENKTFPNEEVQSLLNEKFYFVTLDGEEKNDIFFGGENYSFLPTGTNTGFHALAQKLGTINGQLSYPTTVILDNRYTVQHQFNFFIDSKNMISFLNKVSQQD